MVRWLARGIEPSRTALYNFRDRAGESIVSLVAQQVRQACDAKQIAPTEGVLDGSTVRSCASRHRTINMEKLLGRQQQLKEAIEKDAAGQPMESVPQWMAQTPSGRLDQKKRYDKAQVELERRLAENAGRPKDKRLEEKKVVISASDPEAPVSRDKEKVFTPLYTFQCITDPESLMVLSFEVYAKATDAGTLAPMLDRTAEVLGYSLQAVTTDAGYVSLLDLQECQKRNVELFGPVQENDFTEKKRAKAPQKIGREQFTWDSEQQRYLCPEGHEMPYAGQQKKWRSGDRTVVERRYACPPEHCRGCPMAEKCTSNPDRGRVIKRLEGQELLDAQREKMKTPNAKSKSRGRGQVIERVFADAKRHRSLRRLHSNGLARARAEIGLVIFSQNLLNARRLRANAEKQGG